MKTLWLLNEVARSLSLPAHRISYAISSGKIREPELRLNNKRIFAMEDVNRVKAFFAAKKEAHAQ